MKKLLALALALTLTLSLAACTTDDAGAQDDVDTSSVSDAADSSSQELEDFVAQVNAELEGQSTEEMAVEVIARDGSLVYVYTYGMDIGDVSEAKPALDDGLAANAATFEMVYESLLAVDPEAKSVIVEYYTMNNELITSQEFN